MKTLLACSALVFASLSLSAAVVTGGGTTTGTSTGTTTTTTTTTVVTPKPSTGTCQKPVTQPAVKSVEVKCEKEASKPAPLKSAAPTCAKK